MDKSKIDENVPPVEKLTQTLIYKGVKFELVSRADVIWVGCVDYASDNTGESDIGATLKRFQGLVGITPIRDKINPDWSASLSINYARPDKPCGIMFANESYTDRQDDRYDILTQPGGLWLRVKGDSANAKALLNKDRADLYEFFEPLGIAAKENGYIQNPDINIAVEYHCHAEYSTPPHTCYAYIPVIKLQKREATQSHASTRSQAATQSQAITQSQAVTQSHATTQDTVPYVAQLKNFLDGEGRLKSYPSKHKMQIFALFYLASKFESGKRYSEKEVNQLLSEWHIFGDYAILRRDLCGKRFLGRDPKGKEYWLEDTQPTPASFGVAT